MENEIKMNDVIEAVTEGTESAIDAAADGAKDVVHVYIGAAFVAGAVVTIAAKAAWKYAIKPGVRKLKALKVKRDVEKLESYIEVTEAEENETKEDNEESK